MQWLKQIKTRAQDHFQVFHKVKNTNTFGYDVYNEDGKWEMGQTNGIKINQDEKMVTWSYLSVISYEYNFKTKIVEKLRNQPLSLENGFAFLDMSSILEELWSTLSMVWRSKG